MKKDVFTYMIAGQAGEGVKKAGSAAVSLFSGMNREVFQMNDYQSLIRGGHNFTVVSSSTSKLYSHYGKADIIVALDRKSYDLHKNEVADNGVMIYNSDELKGDGIGIAITGEAKKYNKPDLIKGVAGIAALVAYLKIGKDVLDQVIKEEYGRGLKDNLSFAHTIYDLVSDKVNDGLILKKGKRKKVVLSGSETIALGAAAAGLDIFYAYPMTPATPLLHFFSKNGKKLGIVTVQPENEIAVANMAIGSAFTGAVSMVGTSGGGFCLMQEAYSLSGMTEIPVLFYLGQRPGPSTGVPTYTEQGELLFSLYPGHGEFPRLVASPGTIEEAFYLTAELLNLIWKFQTPAVLLSEKHLSESMMSVDIRPQETNQAKATLSRSKNYKRYQFTESGISPLLFPPNEQLVQSNSYEHDEQGFTTEEAAMIAKMHKKRLTKQNSMIHYLQDKIKTINVFGNGSPYIFTFGSTTMSVLEAIEYAGIKATVVQLIYLQPFPVWMLEKFKDKKSIVVEQNATGQLEQLLREKAGIKPVHSIRQFDGRPFDPIELGKKLREVE